MYMFITITCKTKYPAEQSCPNGKKGKAGELAKLLLVLARLLVSRDYSKEGEPDSKVKVKYCRYFNTTIYFKGALSRRSIWKFCEKIGCEQKSLGSINEQIYHFMLLHFLFSHAISTYSKFFYTK